MVCGIHGVRNDNDGSDRKGRILWFKFVCFRTNSLWVNNLHFLNVYMWECYNIYTFTEIKHKCLYTLENI